MQHVDSYPDRAAVFVAASFGSRSAHRFSAAIVLALLALPAAADSLHWAQVERARQAYIRAIEALDRAGEADSAAHEAVLAAAARVSAAEREPGECRDAARANDMHNDAYKRASEILEDAVAAYKNALERAQTVDGEALERDMASLVNAIQNLINDAYGGSDGEALERAVSALVDEALELTQSLDLDNEALERAIAANIRAVAPYILSIQRSTDSYRERERS